MNNSQYKETNRYNHISTEPFMPEFLFLKRDAIEASQYFSLILSPSSYK